MVVHVIRPFEPVDDDVIACDPASACSGSEIGFELKGW